MTAKNELTDPAALDALVEALRDWGFVTASKAADTIAALCEKIAYLTVERDEAEAERDAWKSQCEAVWREAAKCFAAQEEIDAAWDAFGTSGNRKVLSLAEQIASHQREVDEARAQLATAEARGRQVKPLVWVDEYARGRQKGHEDAAAYISRAIDAITSGAFDQSDPRIETLCEFAAAIGEIPSTGHEYARGRNAGLDEAARAIGSDSFPIDGMYEGKSLQEQAYLNALAAAQNAIRALIAQAEKGDEG